MISLTINNRSVEIAEGSTILQAAQSLGISIPTMCHKDGFEPTTSCMACVVQVDGYKHLVPSCGSIVHEGMVVYTNTPKVLQARENALELLLSDHVGDCEGPCENGCPAEMDIPLMIRQIKNGKLDRAIVTVKRSIPLPAVLGRICPGPCEKVCRRADHDESVSICLLKRFVADYDLQSDKSYLPVCAAPSGKRIAIVGGGACGLSASYYLVQKGHQCIIFDKNEKPGGELRNPELQKQGLSLDILDQELDLILKLGIDFKGRHKLGEQINIEQLKSEFDVVFLATGNPEIHKLINLNLEQNEGKLIVNRETWQTSDPQIFAGGDVIGDRQMCIRAIADGRFAAVEVDSYLKKGTKSGLIKKFNSKLGTLSEQEWAVFTSKGEQIEKVEPDSTDSGYTIVQAQREAHRCLGCDCGKKKGCKLRKLSTEHQAQAKTYKGSRRIYSLIRPSESVIFESGKCINCGLCLQVSKNHISISDLTFAGRGFTMNIVSALHGQVDVIDHRLANECVRICPTGAWALDK